MLLALNIVRKNHHTYFMKLYISEVWNLSIRSHKTVSMYLYFMLTFQISWSDTKILFNGNYRVFFEIFSHYLYREKISWKILLNLAIIFRFDFNEGSFYRSLAKCFLHRLSQNVSKTCLKGFKSSSLYYHQITNHNDFNHVTKLFHMFCLNT